MRRFNSAPEGSAAPLTCAASGQSPGGMGPCGAGCASSPPAPRPAQGGFLSSKGVRCTQGALPEPPWQSAAASAASLPRANALKATCGHDPAVASCAVGWGLHVFFTFGSVGFGRFYSTGFGLFGNAPSVCLWSHSFVLFCFV